MNYEKLFKHPKLIIIILAIITLFFAVQLPNSELDNNNLRFVPDNDEARAINAYIDDIFGSSFFILVALQRNYGDVFNPAFLNRIREFNQRIEEYDIIGDINSIVSSEYIFAENDAIMVQKLVGNDFSGSTNEIAELRERILSWDIYRNALVSDDFTATQILIPLNIDEVQASDPVIIEYIMEIRDIAMEMFNDMGEVYVTGLPIISGVINEAMRSDLVIMIPLVVIVVLIMLLISFRSFIPVLMPLVSVLTAVIWSMGAMPLFGIKLSVITTVLPVILVAVGSAYSIHFITHYLKDVGSLSGLDQQEHREKTIGVIKKICKPVFMAALTTIAGFTSFCFTTVVPIREFGFFATFGVFSSFIISILLIPSILIIIGPKHVFEKKENTASFDIKIASSFTKIALGKNTVFFIIGAIIIISVWGLTRLQIDNIFIEYFNESSDIARSDRFIRENFGGSKIISIVVEAEDTETLLMPSVLTALDGLSHYLETRVPEAGKVMGFTDLVKRINQVFNAGESPHGLERRTVSDMDFGFGFGDDFGFGNFGFDNNDDFGFDFYGEFNEWEYSETEETDNVQYSVTDIASLLRNAMGMGSNRNMSANDLVRQVERLTNYEGASYYEIPSDPFRYGMSTHEELSNLVANYLILLSSNISTYANDPLSPTAIKNTIQLRTIGNIDTDIAVERIANYIDANFPDNVNVIIGGTAMVEASLNRLVVESQIISVIVSVIIVFFIITISNKSFIAGLTGITPLSICILINFALMGFSGIKLNIGTSMMASLCVGIGIDYSIHYMEAYKREFKPGKPEDFLPATFALSGRAILINALSVGAGFAVLLLSQFIMLKDLGLLISFTMISSSLVCLCFLPVLLSAVKPKFINDHYNNRSIK